MIIEKATELGLALSNSDEFRRMQAAKTAMEQDGHVNDLMKQYTEKQDSIVSMLENSDSDGMTVADLSREIEEIQNELMVNSVFTEMMEAQQNFASLMNEVNKVISAYIGLGEPDGEASSCGGDCSACSGCKH